MYCTVCVSFYICVGCQENGWKLCATHGPPFPISFSFSFFPLSSSSSPSSSSSSALIMWSALSPYLIRAYKSSKESSVIFLAHPTFLRLHLFLLLLFLFVIIIIIVIVIIFPFHSWKNRCPPTLSSRFRPVVLICLDLSDVILPFTTE